MLSRIRNFTIIAHIDHGKSTLTDRFLQICKAIPDREFVPQILDSMSLEREKGITIKAQTCNLTYKYKGEEYYFNLIDTPGHYDFHYEVNRSMAACEFSLLLIDATQGIQAQTLSHFKQAILNDHLIIPVINKVDLASSNIPNCLKQIEKLGLNPNLVMKISAKTGEGVETLLEKIIEIAPPPTSSKDYFRALIIDSWFDKYTGIITLIKILDGQIKPNTKVKMCSNGQEFTILNLGKFKPKKVFESSLEVGEIGFLVTQMKNYIPKIGDTLVESNNMEYEIVSNFKESTPLVFCSFYNEDPDLIEETHNALKKYQLNDSSFSFSPEKSDLHGITFRCGFLGLLHIEIVKERIYREFGVELSTALPSVEYRLTYTDKNEVYIKDPKCWPTRDKILFSEEPEANCTIFTPNDYMGDILKLCRERRAIDINIESEEESTQIRCKIPLSEIVLNFSDKLSSISSGFASFEYEIEGWRHSHLGKLMILINDKEMEDFSTIVPVEKSREVGLTMVRKLKELIPRCQISIKIQAVFDSIKNIIGREDITPYRKDVIAKCYGGDITRKKKLLEKQKKGKKKMKNDREVNIPSSVFINLNKI